MKPNRKKALDFIAGCGNAGCTTAELTKHMQMHPQNVRDHVRGLLADGYIRREGRTVNARYFVRRKAMPGERFASVEEYLAAKGVEKCPDGFAWGSGWLCEPPAKPDAAPYSRFIVPKGGTLDLGRERAHKATQKGGRHDQIAGRIMAEAIR